jgi:hypothetical protein
MHSKKGNLLGSEDRNLVFGIKVGHPHRRVLCIEAARQIDEIGVDHIAWPEPWIVREFTARKAARILRRGDEGGG